MRQSIYFRSRQEQQELAVAQRLMTAGLDDILLMAFTASQAALSLKPAVFMALVMLPVFATASSASTRSLPRRSFPSRRSANTASIGCRRL
jgi:hypothetical protein